ncbi:MAG: S8 family serine peptidase [Labilithrix sp.]|nr:S8 family serine peptidase [Labilithrix sp.]MCW5815949.1 S8 family serine peptidase [Labilithrix sp.]
MPNRTSLIVRSPLFALVLAACSVDAAPADTIAPAGEPTRPATNDDTTTGEETAPGTPAAPAEEAAAVAPAACATAPKLATGHAYETVECPTQLGGINHWASANAWKKLDAVPVTVAVLDGAFNTEHPDLSGAFALTYNFAKPQCATYDAGDAACTNVSPPPSPPAAQLGAINHGTIISGVIAGRGEPGRGIVGVNPSAKILGVGRDASNDNLKALAWAVGQKPDVISMSWPLGPAPGEREVPAFEALLEEATAKGIVVVMAAGNTKTNVDDKALYPTRYSAIPGVIAVGAVDDDGAFFAQFSNYGPRYVDIGAPGKVISSGGDYATGRYSVQAGTSFSGPLVAAAASRVIQYLKDKDVTYTAADVERLVVEGSKADPKLEPYFREGRVLDMTTLHAHVTAKH